MNCRDCLSLIELYFDAALDERTAALVTAHMAHCPACSGEYTKLQDEQDLYLRYECEAPEVVTSVIWEGVRARLRSDVRAAPSTLFGRLQRRLAAVSGRLAAPIFSPTATTAAAMIFAVGLTLALMNYTARHEGAVPPTDEVTPSAPSDTPSRNKAQIVGHVAAPDAGPKRPPLNEKNGGQDRVKPARGGRAGRVTGRASAARAPDELVREAEQKYLAAIAILARDVKVRGARLPPEIATSFGRTLASVDQVIADTRRAVRQHPRDPVAAQYMLTAYAKKVEVLREIARR